jgi:hypothetical protein
VGGEPRELVSPEQLDAMTDVMTHRGPNDRGTYAAPGIAVGVRRLSIVDVEGGHQPFLNEERSWWRSGTASSITSPISDASWGAMGTCSRADATRRSCRICMSGMGLAFPSGSAESSVSPRGTNDSGAPGS